MGSWALALLGVVVVGLEVLGSLTFCFRPVSLVTVLLMLVPGAAGAALVLKNLSSAAARPPAGARAYLAPLYPAPSTLYSFDELVVLVYA